jgi:hypothetical protein
MKEDGAVTSIAIVTNDGSLPLHDLEEALQRALYNLTSFKEERERRLNSNLSAMLG